MTNHNIIGAIRISPNLKSVTRSPEKVSGKAEAMLQMVVVLRKNSDLFPIQNNIPYLPGISLSQCKDRKASRVRGIERDIERCGVRLRGICRPLTRPSLTEVLKLGTNYDCSSEKTADIQ